MLLTKAALSVQEGVPLDPPPLHLLCIIDSIDGDEKRRGQKTVTGHLNLQTGATGDIRQVHFVATVTARL